MSAAKHGTDGTAAPHLSRGSRSLLLQLARTRRLAFVSLVFLVLLVVVAVAAPVISPYSPLVGDISQALQSPSAQHLLGTDQVGRDVLSRLIWGTRPTLVSALQAIVVALALGVSFGVVAGFAGGIAERALMFVSDVLMSMPGMVMLLIVLTIFQNDMNVAMFAFGAFASGSVMRIVRAATLGVRQELFIDAARTSGLSTPRILVRHVLPRIGGAVMVQGTLLASMAILLSTGLAYLGFGAQPPNPSWGSMIGDGSQIMGRNPTMFIASGVAIGLTVVACGVLGEGLRDVVFIRWSGPLPVRTGRLRVQKNRAPQRAEDTDALLEVNGLRIGYRLATGDSEVVHGVDLRIGRGEAVALVGESGSGKTATARAILGILKGGGIRSGRILYDGKDTTEIGAFAAGARAELSIGYISQEPQVSLDPSWRVGAQLAESIRLHRPALSKKEAREHAVELLRRMQLADPERVARQYPHQLSGGMAQRVALARALSGDPKLLIADEPTTALDVTVQAEILDLLRSIQAETGMSILMITHDWGVVSDLCARAYVMRDGIVLESGTVLDLVEHPSDPYTRRLLESNPAVMLAEAHGPKQPEGAVL